MFLPDRAPALRLRQHEVFQGLWEFEDVGESVVVDVAVNEVQFLERGLVRPLERDEAFVAELGAPDDEGFEIRVREDVDVFAQVQYALSGHW